MPDIAPIPRVRAGDGIECRNGDCPTEQQFCLCEIASLNAFDESVSQDGWADKEKVRRGAQQREGDHYPAQ